MSIMANIRMHLSGLTNFSGRETRVMFWPWVGLAFGLAMAANVLLMTQLVMPAVLIADVAEEIVAAMRSYAMAMGIVASITVALLAAAVVRRLHDAGQPVWIGLVPLPFLAFGLIWFIRVMSLAFVVEEVDSGFTAAFALGFLNNLIYLATLVFLVVCLARRSEPQENRHGPQPG